MNQIKNLISGIGLQNFQVFGKYTFIPLAPLTLIYGPNSAGKSSLFDAIELAKFFWTPANEVGQLNNSDIAEKQLQLKSQFRRTTKDSIFNPIMKIDIEIPARYGSQKFRESSVNKMLACLSFSNPESDCGSVKVINRSLYVDGELLFQAGNEGFVININHSMSIQSQFGSESISGTEITVEYPFIFENGFLTLPSGWARLNPNFTVSSNVKNKKLTDEKLSHEVISKIDQFVDALGNYFSEWEYAISSALDFAHVDASRTIPTSSELIYIVNNPWEMAVTTNGNDEYFYLAAGCLNQQLVRQFPEDDEINDFAFGLNNLNHILRHHLFLDRAYQISADIRYLVAPELLQSATPKLVSDLGDFGAVVQLKLIDPEGRRFDFTDVGSGMGYVLPVLLKCSSHKLCFIEQPELHLHPALQSALGDIFIELADLNNDIEDTHSSTLLIETHSEHVLLRILKRIRQTSSKINIEENIKLQAEDLAVLYFDPLPNGETIVKRLRVTEEGEFMDRWPRGFFEERDQELFDE